MHDPHFFIQELRTRKIVQIARCDPRRLIDAVVQLDRVFDLAVIDHLAVFKHDRPIAKAAHNAHHVTDAKDRFAGSGDFIQRPFRLIRGDANVPAPQGDDFGCACILIGLGQLLPAEGQA